MTSEVDHLRSIAQDIKQSIENSTYDERKVMLTELYNKWVIPTRADMNIFDFLKLAISNFSLTTESLNSGTFDRAHRIALFNVSLINLHLIGNNPDISDEDKALFEPMLVKISKAITDAGNAIFSSLYLASSMSIEDADMQKRAYNEIFRQIEINYETLNPQQILIIYLLEQLRRKEYRRYVNSSEKGTCYQKVYNDSNQETHAWKPAMSIRNFVYDMTRKEFNGAMWVNFTSAKDMGTYLTNYLTKCLSHDFIDIAKDRHVFSFKNGLYIAKVANEEYDDSDPDSNAWRGEFIEYSSTRKIPASIVSSKYFDLDFEDCSSTHSDFFSIIQEKCPNFMSIMNHQQWPEDVQRWMCIFIGRMIYDTGDLDNWQVFVFLLGLAGTGKSTIIEYILKQFYESADVGILGNNTQKQFALSAIIDKFIVLAPEVKGNWSIDQAQLQSWISGETCIADIKHQAAVVIEPKAHLVIAGNVAPEFQDNAGSMSRRTIVFPFNHKVKKGDTNLGNKIKKEIAYIIQACNRAYITAVHEYGSSSVWDSLPELFKEAKEAISEEMHPLASFLTSDTVIIDKDLYCREKVFVAAFNDYCRDTNSSVHKWAQQFYSGPFANHGITVSKNVRRRYPNRAGEKSHQGTFIFGIDIKDDGDCSDSDSGSERNLFV